MSEFTDYHQFLTEAQSLDALRGQLEQSVGAAEVPLYELGGAAFERAEAEATWAALPKPAWVMLGLADTGGEALDRLATQGPALRLVVEEDFSSWAVRARCGAQIWTYAFLRAPDVYREVTGLWGDGKIWSPETDAEGTAALATCLRVDPTALAATFIADGGQSFSALIGAHYEQMEDLSDPDLPTGTILFPFDLEAES